MALSSLLPVDRSRRGRTSPYAAWLVALPLLGACVALDPNYQNPLLSGGTGTSGLFPTTETAAGTFGTGDTQGWSSNGVDATTTVSGGGDTPSEESSDTGTSGETVDFTTDDVSSGSESSGGSVEPLPPDCRSPVQLHAYSGELWDAEAVGARGAVLSQYGDDTLWQRFDASGAMSAEPLVYAQGISHLDLLARGNDTYVAYDAETDEGRRAFLMINGGGPDPAVDTPLPVDGGATARMPKIAFASAVDTEYEEGDAVLLGYVEERQDAVYLSFAAYAIDTGRRRINTGRPVGSGSGPAALRHWIYPAGQGLGVRSSAYALVQGEREVVQQFGVDAHIVSESNNVPLQGSVLIDFGSEAALIGINGALDRVELSELGSMSPIDVAGLDAPDETCSHAMATHDDTALVATFLCTRNGLSRIRAVTLNGELEEEPTVASDVLDEPREVLDHRVVYAADRVWSVWMEPSGLWIAPICSP